MTSKGPRSKLDHESRARRQKVLEVPKEPRRPKTHWDHVLEEMVWLSKDFESEKKWKLAQAKRVAIRASKSLLEHATLGERKVKEEELRLRKISLGISKDVKKFWMKIEKLVLYKHQLELEERKKKALDKQLDFLLDQTERYSTMLAENLIDMPFPSKQGIPCVKQPLALESGQEQPADQSEKGDEGGFIGSPEHPGSYSDNVEHDEDFDMHSEEESEDDEQTMEDDEALITEEERREELEALQNEVDMPLEELLKRYMGDQAIGVKISESSNDAAIEPVLEEKGLINSTSGTVMKEINNKNRKERASSDFSSELVIPVSVDEGNKYFMCKPFENSIIADMATEGKGVLQSDGKEIETCDGKVPAANLASVSRASLPEKQHQSDEHHVVFTPVKVKESNGEVCILQNGSALDEESGHLDFGDELDDIEYILTAEDEKDDETTLAEEEEFAKSEANDPSDEIKLLQQESEMPLEELLAMYKMDTCKDEDDLSASECASTSSEEQVDHSGNKEVKGEDSGPDEDRDGLTVLPSDSTEIESFSPLKHSVMQKLKGKLENRTEEGRESENIIADAAAAARSAQPTGNTFLTTKVRTKFPFLLKHPLREYQHIGLDWLVTMYEKRLNGILADEMGLGKTIMTISLLAHLACEKGIWGPHLIVVPTSVMLNWETEFLKWCPAFKILTYFGTAKERKNKRQGWLKPNSFHVCITTYRLVIQDAKVFKRKKWKYLILDEAHLIKNWKSQRWQTLLNFNSKRRILLTGTPLQNDLMELWSLMHFLMPHVFQSHQEFKDWFSNPISGMVEGQDRVNKEVVDRLHNVLRPFILRRLKRDVEKQLPKKYEHVIYCRLSRRQRNLYEDFIASSETQETLASANFFGMISIIMQLRKVCNHPDLFEGRPIISSFDMVGIYMQLSSSVCTVLSSGPLSKVDLMGLSFLFTHLDFSMTSWENEEFAAIATPSNVIVEVNSVDKIGKLSGYCERRKRTPGNNIFEEIQRALIEERVKEARERAASFAWWHSLLTRRKPTYGTNLREVLTIKHPVLDIHQQKMKPSDYMNFSSKLGDIILLPTERLKQVFHLVECFMFAIPAARAPMPVCWCSKQGSPVVLHPAFKEICTEVFGPLLAPIRPAIVRRQVYFPDRRLIQFDCGKLQQLAILLRRLKSEGHRALIFTQMTKMLDILEAFISLYGYTYMRLDGSTQPEERQTLMQRFNTNPKIFLFILSTRSGGVGINLVGADTVIFYDSDWNPAMDNQAQDRCHRIGQTREVHIYRLISESTIEENILKKANQKRALDDLVIQSGGYNTEFFKKLDPMELFSGHRTVIDETMPKGDPNALQNSSREALLSNAEVEAALKLAEDEADYMALKKVELEEAVDNQEFLEEAMGRLEDDEYANDDDGKPDEKRACEDNIVTDRKYKTSGVSVAESIENEDKALMVAGEEDDLDMLADVKQMAAAAAAAGQASSSFENQLRPIDRYAMRFLDLWDPIVDKSAIESQVRFEETEWELERLEKLKEDLEAEIDEDEEPLQYESWDTELATEAYRQHVEALAQRQLMEELESETREAADDDDQGDTNRKVKSSDRKTKTKKKTKKAKFKSLKKGALASDSEALPAIPIPEAPEISKEKKTPSSAAISVSNKKRRAPKLPNEGKIQKKGSKKHKKGGTVGTHVVGSESQDKNSEIESPNTIGIHDVDVKPASRSKMGGKISITAMPVKRVMVIKLEKAKYKKEHIPSPDSWTTQEDALLCAIVHEYGLHWNLASDTLYGMPAGGFYRGRFRHPAHCLKRFRELFLGHISSATENPNTEKNHSGGAKALLKVTEDHVHWLLDVASDQPDNELLLQKHFTAILSSVWRARSCYDHIHGPMASRNSCSLGRGQISDKLKREPARRFLALSSRSSKLVSMALNSSFGIEPREHPVNYFWQQVPPTPSMENRKGSETLEIRLVLGNGKDDWGEGFPSNIDLLISGSDPEQPAPQEQLSKNLLPQLSCQIAEVRFRLASNSCFEGEGYSWASSAFPISEFVKHRSSKSSTLGKHKLSTDPHKTPKSKLAKTTNLNEDTQSTLALEIHHPPEPSPEVPSLFSPGNLIHWPDSGIEDLHPLIENWDDHAPQFYDTVFFEALEDLSWLDNPGFE
ncbi:protein PHOTOPERIOD-INDEPENDENT EARLY FLOWERING 1 isoform X1 [Amborella trichopoda]|uniref:protein PHOTOPERIOD-INDEPENDENT EARLY FLOWERING 1 isoform X1 n=1 Tax=Amborella trichopoda TaxID=13333 RepID=UPI0009C08219|nr:protein PHOTOPERIOD-INDEPENDENT EARLY FLOWERING 1 isoform X1 [Amborella trichopoda]|eukprot:XP_011622082.2 protein PHOTOPERIOD-INDEPENDENT EARLY FLOWERING 1 isoform X1 [Amborella trichopoda]